MDHQQHHEIDIPNDQPQPPQAPAARLLLDLLGEGRRADYIQIAIPLYEASIRGDWEAVRATFEGNRELVRSAITLNHDTPLHIAASARNSRQVEEFVTNLVGMMTNEELLLKNKNENTALCLAAQAGNVNVAEMMVQRNRGLLDAPGSQGMMPLYMAALFGKYDMVRYLYNNSNRMGGDFWRDTQRSWVLQKCVEVDMFDIALTIVQDRPELLTERTEHVTDVTELTIRRRRLGDLLLVLARKSDAFTTIKPDIIWRIIKSITVLKVGPPENESAALRLLRIIWENIVQMPTHVIDDIIRGRPDPVRQADMTTSEKADQALQLLELISQNIIKMTVVNQNTYTGPAATTSINVEATPLEQPIPKYSSRILFVAAEMGNTKFVVELIRKYPDLIWKVNDNDQSIFHIAIKHRHEDIYNLLYEIGSMKDLITPKRDKNENTMLHLVGKSAKKKRLQDVSGVALQMQRELLWFQEVEAMIPPSSREKKNNEGLTAYELFTKEHKDLVVQGEKWMKGTANQCLVVAALIATMVFAAAFTVPGGYNQDIGKQDNGIPIFYRKRTFIVFVVADAISLFSSSASILMFLSILTSRYAEGDFLKSLPTKLMLGLATLFLSIVTMVVAFGISFFVLYHKNLKWIPILISSFATMPVLLFAWLQYPLLADVISSTYGSTYLFKPKKRMLY